MFKQDELNLKLLSLFYTNRDFAVININYILPEFFENETYKNFITFIKEFYYKTSHLPTKPIIMEHFQNLQLNDNSAEIKIVEKILNTECDETSKSFFEEKVPALYRKNKLLPTIIEGFKNIKQLEDDDKYLDDFYAKLQEIILFSKEKNLGLNFYNVDERYIEIEDEYSIPFKTNWKILNNIIGGGFFKKRLYMWSAPPGFYKTALLANLAIQFFLTGRTLVFFTLELSRADISHRCDQILTNIASKELKTNNYALLKEYLKNAKENGAGSLYFQELKDGATVSDIESYCELIRLKENKKVDLILVDYVDLMQPMIKQKNWKSYEIQGQTTRELRNFGKNYNISCITVTQSTRQALENGGGTKEEGGMELVADSFNKPRIADLFAQIVMTKTDRQMNLLKMHIVKNRLGQADVKVVYKINPLTFSLKEAEENEQ